MIQRPMSSSLATLSITSSGIGSSPSYHCERLEKTAAEKERVQDLRDHPDRLVEHQLAQRVDDGRQVALAPDLQPARHEALRRRQQPDAHLRDDPVVRLHEELVGSRPEPALVDVRGLAVRDPAAARPHQLAVREHDLHPALHPLVDAVGEVRDPVVERVPDDAAPAEVGDGEHQLVAARLDRVVEVEPADARLDDRVRRLLVDLEHAVHPAEVDDDRAAHPRRGAAVAVVLADARDPDRHPVLVGDPDDLLDLLDRLRLDDGRGLVVVPARGTRRDRGTRAGPPRRSARAPSRRRRRTRRGRGRAPARTDRAEG